MLSASVVLAAHTGIAAADDTSLKTTLTDASQEATTVARTRAFLQYPIPVNLANLMLRALNGTGRTATAPPSILVQVRNAVVKAERTIDLAQRYRTRFLIARTSLRADQASSGNGRIAKSLGLQGAGLMLAALDSRIRMENQAINKLERVGAGCYIVGNCPPPTLDPTTFPEKAGSGADILKAALKRLG